MFIKTKNAFWAFCLLACFPLYSIGQILLLVHENSPTDLYLKMTRHSQQWTQAHLVLMLSLLMMIPAFLAIGSFLKNRRHPIWFGMSFLFTILSVFSLFGQYCVDLCMVDIFSLPKDQAMSVYQKIQSNKVTNSLFFDNSQLFSALRYLDFWFIGQIFLAGAFLVARKLPVWSLIVFFVALTLTQLGPLFMPHFGKTAKWVGFAFYSMAYYPIAVYIIQNKKSKSTAGNTA